MSVQSAAIGAHVSLLCPQWYQKQQNWRSFASILFLYDIVVACAEILEEEKFIGEIEKDKHFTALL